MMPSKEQVRQQYRELLRDGVHRKHQLNYVIAQSSGLNVTQEIPDEAYKRAAWASNQGASFVEISIGGPSQIYNEWDNLISISRQLGLSYDCHFPVQVPFDYATPYREQREQIGYEYAHEFMYDFIQAWGEFKRELERRPDANGDQQQVYGINSHLVKSTIPTEEERMAGSVSLDPFGEDIMESRIFANKCFRVSFFKHYMWPEDLRDNFDTMQSIANQIEGFNDFSIIQREVYINHLLDNGYIDRTLLSAVRDIGSDEQLKETVRYKAQNELGDYERDRVVRVLAGKRFSRTETIMNPRTQQEEEIQVPGMEEAQEFVNQNGIYGAIQSFNDEELDAFINGYQMRTGGQDTFGVRPMYPQPDMQISSAMQNIAGTRADIPEDLEDLKDHDEGANIAIGITRFDPHMYTTARWSDFIPVELWTRDPEDTLRDQQKRQTVLDEATEKLKEHLREAVVEQLEQESAYDGYRDYMEETDRQLSHGEVVFRDIINFRGGYYRDEMSRPSIIFWEIMPRWLPFADHEQLRYIWDEITEMPSSQYSYSNLDTFDEDLQEIQNSKHYDWPIAAGAGAYVWGHFTQYRGRGQEKYLVELLDEYELTLDWESHNVGNQGNGKLWKPHDIIKVCQAINNTVVNGETHEVLFCTIDMEHLAMSGIDPLWAIKGTEEMDDKVAPDRDPQGIDPKELRGIDEGDGRMITKQHATHPALSEQQHHHQPIRRGDKVVYEHIEALVDKGFTKREDRPAVIMYELGAEKAESIFMLRLMMSMLEVGITSKDLESANVDRAWKRYDEGKDITLEEYLILKFYGLTDEEWHHEWQEIFEHALDPLEGLLEGPGPDHTWSGRGALAEDNRPEDWQREEYQ